MSTLLITLLYFLGLLLTTVFTMTFLEDDEFERPITIFSSILWPLTVPFFIFVIVVLHFFDICEKISKVIKRKLGRE